MKRTFHKYSEDSLKQALQKIRNNEMGFRKASKEYGIPVSTLHDKIHGKAPDEPRKMGPATVLSVAEEQKIVDWLLNIAKCGFPQKPNELLDVVEKIIKDDNRKTVFKNGRPGRKWYYSFLNRHKELTLRTPENINKARTIVTKESIHKWFTDFALYLKEINCLDILKDPTRIFNGDETSFNLAPKTGTVIAPKGYHNVYQISMGNDKENITVLLVFAASGETLPPMIVYPYLCPPAKLVNSMPEDWILGRSESGWMRTETFYEYVANGFNQYLIKNNIKKPVLFLVDGHKSHLSLHLSEFCDTNQILLYSLPPNTTHIMQPADVGAFKGLKSQYKTTVRTWQNMKENFGKSVTKTNFATLVKMVLDSSDRADIVKNSFRKCGLFPFNPDAVDYSKCVQNNLENVKKWGKIESNVLSNKKFEAAKEVINSIKNNLLNKNVDFQVVLDTIIEAQGEANDAVMEIDCTTLKDGIYEFQNGNLVRVDSNCSDEINKNLNDKIESTSLDLPVVMDKSSSKFLDFPKDVNETACSENLNDKIESTSLDLPVVMDKSSSKFLDFPKDVNETACSENINNRTESSSLDFPVVTETSSIPLDSPEKEGESTAFPEVYQVPSTLSSVSSFDKHLKYPDPIKTKKGKEVSAENRPPMSISASSWREFYRSQEEIKRKKKDEIEKRKKQRNLLKLKNIKIKKEIRNTKKFKNNRSNNKRIKLQCAECHDDLDTDVEDDALKNIGCDKCDKWYHLQCTTLCDMSFEDAQKEELICTFCSEYHDT